MGENPSDFNLAIDNFFDLFARDSLVEINGNEPENGEQSSNYQMRPRIMKNDIRRYYSRMFMNTVNSGEFNLLQGFFSTFMMGPANFTVNHDGFDPSFGMPSILAGTGPKLMVHFHLGMFVMFPDTVIRMTSSQIVTSNAWSGTKIEMFVDVSCTKIHALSDDEWIPSLDLVEDKCSKLAEEKRHRLKQEALAAEAAAAAAVSSADSSTLEQDEDRPGIYDSFPPFDPVLSLSTDCDSHMSSIGENCSGEARLDEVSLEKVTSMKSNHSSNSDLIEDTTGKPENSQDKANHRPARKRRRTRRRSTPDTKTDLSTPHSNENGENGGNSDHSNFISEEYIHMLCGQATLLPRPILLRMDGTITLFLDENNHIQHLNIRARPKTE